MRKPITIMNREFVVNLETLINESGLPSYMLLPVMRQAVSVLESIDEHQYQRDLEEWNKAVQESGEQTDQQS